MLTLNKAHHDATITIDDEPILFHVKRLGKAEGIQFEREFFRHGQPRGDQELTEAQKDAARQFVEDTISAYISVEPGQIKDGDHDVTTGDDVIRAFCTRADVLGAVYQLAYSQNFLGKAQKKILSRAAFSFPGSLKSMLVRDGDEPKQTAASVESSSSVPPAAATVSSGSSAADVRALSGAAAG